MREEKRYRGIWGVRLTGLVVSGLLVGTILAFFFGYFVKLLWNWIMPEIFGLATITYWQGFGLVLLARLLFGSWGTSGGGRRGMKVHAGEVSAEEFSRGGVYLGAVRGERRGRRIRYRDWWRDEGKAAFEAYVERKHEAPDGPGPQES